MNTLASPGLSAAAGPRVPRGLGARVFGHEHRMRVRVQRSMLSASIYLCWMVVEAYCAATGRIPWHHVALLAAYNLIGLTGFYLLLRSGFSERLRDPSLVLEQALYAVGAIALAYVLVPPTRAAALQVLCIIQVFGMFTLRPRETVQACVWTMAVLVGTLALMWWARLPGFDVQRETINVALSCLILPVLTVITRHFAQLREDLLAQKAQLKDALARVQEQATRDVLTGLFNRAHMQALLEQECGRHARGEVPFCVALIDLDHFKRINDTHGHAVGDEVLVSFAALAGDTLRQTDVVARWGGEEFLVLLPESDPQAACEALQRLQARVAACQPSAVVEGLRIGFSAGLASWRAGEPVEAVLERADRALYRAKNRGRGRTECADFVTETTDSSTAEPGG